MQEVRKHIREQSLNNSSSAKPAATSKHIHEHKGIKRFISKDGTFTKTYVGNFLAQPIDMQKDYLRLTIQSRQDNNKMPATTSGLHKSNQSVQFGLNLDAQKQLKSKVARKRANRSMFLDVLTSRNVKDSQINGETQIFSTNRVMISENSLPVSLKKLSTASLVNVSSLKNDINERQL